MLRIKNIAMIFTAVVITACTGSTGDQFVGKWVNVGDPDITLEIEKDSSSNTFTVTDRMTWMQQPKVSKFTATVDGNSLLLKHPSVRSPCSSTPMMSYKPPWVADALTAISGIGPSKKETEETWNADDAPHVPRPFPFKGS